MPSSDQISLAGEGEVKLLATQKFFPIFHLVGGGGILDYTKLNFSFLGGGGILDY